jgi:hypothetical protein
LNVKIKVKKGKNSSSSLCFINKLLFLVVFVVVFVVVVLVVDVVVVVVVVLVEVALR